MKDNYLISMDEYSIVIDKNKVRELKGVISPLYPKSYR